MVFFFLGCVDSIAFFCVEKLEYMFSAQKQPEIGASMISGEKWRFAPCNVIISNILNGGYIWTRRI